MAKQAKFVSDDTEAPMTEAEKEYFESHTQDWLNTNDTLFKNAILYLSELKRYCYKRNPHSRMNKFIGSLCDIHGHLNLLVLGTHTDYREIDRFSFLSKVTVWAQCQWSPFKLDTTRVLIRRNVHFTEMGSFDLPRKPFRYWVNGVKPRVYLNGENFYALYNTQNLINLRPVLPKEMAYAAD